MDHLVSRARQGDKNAENEILRNLSARFHVLAKQRIKDPETARDIAQDACLTVLQKYRSETFTKGFEPWAYGVLRMKIGNYYQMASTRQAKNSKRDAETATEGTTFQPPDAETERRLLICLRKLLRINRLYARTLNLMYQGYKTDEICERLGTTPSAHYSNLNRARTFLKKCIQEREHLK
jgi:RNA polymerase sigma factor (sigma-70 family)